MFGDTRLRLYFLRFSSIFQGSCRSNIRWIRDSISEKFKFKLKYCHIEPMGVVLPLLINVRSQFFIQIRTWATVMLTYAIPFALLCILNTLVIVSIQRLYLFGLCDLSDSNSCLCWAECLGQEICVEHWARKVSSEKVWIRTLESQQCLWRLFSAFYCATLW